jgi:phosphohistidine phosphatase
MRSLWIMRHGNAEWDAPSDRERQLSQSGTEQVASVAKKLDLEFPLDIWFSPFVRAQQTCEQLTEHLQQKPIHAIEEPLLTPDSDPDMLVELINATESKQLMLVSHMPLVGRLTKQLTGDERVAGYQTAQIVKCIKADDGDWQLAAIYSPDN